MVRITRWVFAVFGGTLTNLNILIWCLGVCFVLLRQRVKTECALKLKSQTYLYAKSQHFGLPIAITYETTTTPTNGGRTRIPTTTTVIFAPPLSLSLGPCQSSSVGRLITRSCTEHGPTTVVVVAVAVVIPYPITTCECNDGQYLGQYSK